jgi:hypothetical protein
LLFLSLLVVLISSCGDDGGSRGPNVAPETEIVSGPTPGETQPYLVTIVWKGTDVDGRVDEFDIAWQRGVIACGDLDTLLDWNRIAVRESTFAVAADTCPQQGLCQGTNTFCVRAVDNEGAVDPDPASVSFTATTILPTTKIIYPPRAEGQLRITHPGCLKVRWEGTDEDGQVVEYRYSAKKYDAWPGEGQPPPQGSKTMWSDWMTETEAVIPLSSEGSPWSIYVQSKDNAGAIETFFQDARNHIIVDVETPETLLPSVSVCCSRGPCDGEKVLLGCRSTDNPSNEVINVTVGDTLCFEASFSPGQYSSEVLDIAFLLNDPDIPYSWQSAKLEENTVFQVLAPFGTSTLYVWVRDDYCEYGETNTAIIKFRGNR